MSTSNPVADSTAIIFEAQVSYCGGQRDFVSEGLFLTEAEAQEFLVEQVRSPIRWQEWQPAKWRSSLEMRHGRGSYDVLITKRRVGRGGAKRMSADTYEKLRAKIGGSNVIEDWIEGMQEHGSSLLLNWGEDDQLWEASWITSGVRYTGLGKSIRTALVDCWAKLQRAVATAPWDQLQWVDDNSGDAQGVGELDLYSALRKNLRADKGDK